MGKTSDQKNHSFIDISFIIPAHNAEKTLRRAVNSVCDSLGRGREERLLSYEILIIENGSEDGTEFLARTLQLELPDTVRFMRSEKGVSNARNRGLEEALGKWILFLDADDYLLEGAGTVLKNDMRFTGTDLIVHSFESGDRAVRLCSPQGERFSGSNKNGNAGTDLTGSGSTQAGAAAKNAGSGKALPEDSGQKNDVSGTLEDIMVRMIEDPTRYTSVWSKLLRRDRIEYGHLRFDPALRLSEDSHFLIRYLVLCRRIRLLDTVFYHYSTDNESAVRTWDGRKEEGYRNSLNAVRAFLMTQQGPVRSAFAGYGMMQFNLLMVREIFAASHLSLSEKIRKMKQISSEEPFQSAIQQYDPRRHKGVRYLPVRLLRDGFLPGAAAIYEARVLQNTKREQMR